MGVAAENDVEATHAAGELEIDIHAVVRQQQHRVGLLGSAQTIDQGLQFLFANAEGPVRRETFWMRDRNVRKRLTDHRDTITADFLDRSGLEHPTRGGIERLGAVEGGLFGQEDILRQELALEALEVAAQRILAIGEFPVPGHGFNAEQVRGLDHVGAAERIGEPRALPGIAAIEQQGTLRAGVVAQTIDQGFQMGKAAELAETGRGLLEIEGSEGIGVGAFRLDAESVEKGVADQMRWLSSHRANPEIDARLTKIAGQKLRMRIGDVQDPRIAEAFKIVDAGIGTARRARQAARERRGAR